MSTGEKKQGVLFECESGRSHTLPIVGANVLPPQLSLTHIETRLSSTARILRKISIVLIKT
jgi:hypothetical protein